MQNAGRVNYQWLGTGTLKKKKKKKKGSMLCLLFSFLFSNYGAVVEVTVVKNKPIVYLNAVRCKV